MLRLGRKELSVSLLAMAALALPVSAHAVEVSTSPVYADAVSNGSYHACNVANVSASPVTLQVLMAASNGVVIASSGAVDITLNAGTSYELTQTTYTGFAICRFRLSGTEAKVSVRANISVFHFTGVFYDTLALSEAR
jgi:hypothetical protein